jgi:hypothetical protein
VALPLRREVSCPTSTLSYFPRSRLPNKQQFHHKMNMMLQQ